MDRIWSGLKVVIKGLFQWPQNYYELFSHTDAEINRGDLTPFVIGTLQLID
jgi:hypothetical protein